MGFTIKSRLIGIVGLLCVLLTVAAVWAILGLRAADQRAISTYRTELLPLQHSAKLYRLAQMQSATLFESLRYWTDPAEVDQRVAQIDAYGRQIATERKAYEATFAVPGSEKLRTTFLDDLNSYQAAISHAAKLVAGGNPSGALVIIETRLKNGSQALQQDIDGLDNLMRSHAENNYATSSAAYATMRNSMAAILAVGLLVAGIAGWLLVRSITGAVCRARRLAESISEGGLNHRLGAIPKDEMGELMQALAKMDARLSGIVREVGESALALSSAAGQMADGNNDLSSRTHAQASSLEQTAASMEQMTATVKFNADNAAQASELAQTVRKQAQQSSGILDDAVTAMRDIEESSNKIADINRVIDEIAFQTNLLALNAAVEAARAGEQGRGFAVVASEVRQLAQRSATAAQEIKTLIQTSVSKVDAGSKLVLRSGETLQEINGGMAKMVEYVADIAVASRQQSSGIDQVNVAIVQMDSATQQNAALVEEASAASHTVNEHAARLVEKMSFFHLRPSAQFAPGAVEGVLEPLPALNSPETAPRQPRLANA
ncbi:MCP four helix bundle domain-containing protein [Rahnella sp. BCC 1045]|jgi:methyl-accepting chemotaxis protein|uniref:methyl-accepting chemotaxis protein n=1 Tax=Rahnella sp. BCC 1045 TaxID=2816251 RepID=UPI001C263B09|nr:methyl-accepting chemotaxis protein [Rahnella sp. BCC 1045]MBU9819733.1 MCP four helix bundle domain-containing protein [Rahnella sp. BCC 1045]